MKKISVSVPGKLMLFGEHAVVYNRPCLVTAVDQRLTTKIAISDQEKIQLEAPEVGIKNYSKKITSLGQGRIPKGAKFVEFGVNNFFRKYKLKQGIKIETKTEFSSQFGFGSSAAVTVGVLVGLAKLFEVNLSKKQLFDLAYQTVLDVQGVGSGFDLAAAIWGGTIYFVTGGKRIIPLKTKSLPLVIGYTKMKADTPTLVKKVAVLREKNKRLIDSVFDQISLVTNKARRVLLKGNFKEAGNLMNINQGLLDALGVNTQELANLIFASRKAGAWGAKLSGAGGGDCMIVFSFRNKKRKIERAIVKAGGEVIKTDANAEGVRIEK